MHDNNNAKQDYEVGYCKPPVATRFQPGKSGNPQGRPPKSKRDDDAFEEALNAKVPLEKNGKSGKVTKRQLMYMQLANQAAKGDKSAAKILLNELHRREKKSPQSSEGGPVPLVEKRPEEYTEAEALQYYQNAIRRVDKK